MERQIQRTTDLFFLKASEGILERCHDNSLFIVDKTKEELERRQLPKDFIEKVLQSGRFHDIRGRYVEVDKLSKVLFHEEEWIFLPYDISVFCDVLLDMDAENIKCLIVSNHQKQYLAFFENTKEKMSEVLYYLKTHNLSDKILSAKEML